MYSKSICANALVVLCLLTISAGSWANQPIDPTKTAHMVSNPVGDSGAQSAPGSSIEGVNVITTPTLLDDFNRADGPIGGNWVVDSGVFNVVSNAARGHTAGLARYMDTTADLLEADVVASSGSLGYVALILDIFDTGNNLFLKVQGSGIFTNAACYYGNNGNSWGLGYFDLSTNFTTAHMRVEKVGTTVTMTFSNIDGGTAIQEYICINAPESGGSGIGIGGYEGNASIDNIAVDAAAPEQEATPVPAISPAGMVLFWLLLAATGLGILARQIKRA